MMGDAANSAHEAAMQDKELQETLRLACPNVIKNCEWFINDDWLYECKTCGMMTDT